MKRNLWMAVGACFALAGAAVAEAVPSACSNAYLWLDAAAPDTLTGAGGVVSAWRSVNAGGVSASTYSISGSGNSPTGPAVVTTNGLTLVSFGSTTANKDLSFPQATNIRAVFMVAKVEQSSNAFLLGDSSAYHFHRGGSGEYWHSSHAADGIKNGKTYRNGTLVSSPTSTVMPADFGLTEVYSTADLTASQLCYDRNGGDPRRGGKDIGELLVFTNEVAQADQTAIRSYLLAKWHLIYDTDDGVHRNDTDLSAGVGLGDVFTQGAGSYGFKNVKLTGNVQGSGSYTLVVEEGDRIEIVDGAGLSGRNKFAWDIRGGSVVWPATASTWYENASFKQSGGTFTAQNTGTTAGDTGSGMLIGFNGSPAMTFDITGGLFSIPSSYLNFYNTSIFNVSSNGTVRVKGTCKSRNAGILNIAAGGTFALGSLGMTADAASVNLSGGAFSAYETTTMRAAINVTDASSIYVPTGITLTVTSALSGTGAVRFHGGGKVVFSTQNPTCAYTVADDGTTVEPLLATVVRAHPRLTRGLDRESLIGVKFAHGAGGTLTNLVVRFDCTNCTPAQITDVRLWKQPHDPVPFAFYEAQAEDEGLGTREEGLGNSLEVRFSPSVTISPSTESQEESDYLWVTAKIDANIATNAEIWASIEGCGGKSASATSGVLMLGDQAYALENARAAAPHRPFPYYYQIGAYVRQDRLVDNGSTTSDVFSNHPELRYPNLTDVIVIYHLTIGSTSSGYAFTAWDTGGYNDTASTAHIVANRNRYHPACMVRGSITGKTFADAGASAASREQFAAYVVNFCREKGLDGIDLDYEWVNDSTNHAEWQKIGKMLRALSEHFFDAGLVLSLSTRLHDSTASGMPYAAADYGAFHTADFITAQTYGGGNINAGHTIQTSGLNVCTKRGVPKRRVVLGQAMFSSQNQYGWDGAVGSIESYVADTLRRYDIDTTNPQSSSYAVFEGPSSYRGQCDWVRSEDIGGVMSWGYYCDVNWTGWASLGRHQAMAVWPLPPVDEASSPRQTEANSYQIDSEGDWLWLFTHPAVSAQLTDDITFTHDPLAIPTWSGTLDGCGHTLTIPADVWVTSGDKAGLIKVLSGTVKNLNIKLAGRVYTLAGRWNDPNQAASTVRVTNYTSGDNHTGVLAGEVASGGRIENVTVEIADGAEVKGVRYVGGLVGYVNDGATLASNRVTVAGIVHEEVRNTFDTLFTPTTPRVGAVYGKLAGSAATLIDNDYTLEATADLQDVDYIPPVADAAAAATTLVAEPIATPVSTYTLNIGAGDWIAEVDFNLTNFAARATTEAYPQLVGMSAGADGSIYVSANRGNNCELFLTGTGTGTYVYPISRAAIRGNGDVGSNVALTLRSGGEGAPAPSKVTLRLENHGGEIRLAQNGKTILVTDKNLPNGGSICRLVFGAGLSQLGGGTVEAVRFASLSPAVVGDNTLVWADEFNTNALDTTCWSKVPLTGDPPNWRKSTSQREELTAVTNGMLVLTGIKNDNADPTETSDYLCGQIWGKDKLSFSRGTFEIRAKFDNQQGAWPAMWMMPDCGNWPLGGEIDISERLDGDAYTYQSVHHGPAPDTYQTKTGAIDNGTWNVYRLEWDNDAITWYVNGTQTATYTNDHTSVNWPFTTPFYFILSQQLGNSFGQTAVDATTLPVRMYVDYVRVYQNPNVTGTQLCVDGGANDPTRWATLHLDAGDAESIVTDAEGVVTNWGAAYAYTLASHSPKGPMLVQEAINGRPAMSFGSTSNDCDLAFDRETGIRSVFMVAKIEQGPNAFVLGDSSAYNFHRGESGQFWSSGNAAAGIRNGTTRWNGAVVANPTGTALPSGWGLLELSTTEGVTASQLCYDRVGNGSVPRRGGKDIAELYLFENALTDWEQWKIRQQLLEKYNLPNRQAGDLVFDADYTGEIDADETQYYDTVTFGSGSTLVLKAADGSKIPYATGFSRVVLTAHAISGVPKSNQDFTFTVVSNGDGTQSLKATRNLGSARVVRAHPLLTRGVGQESLVGVDFSGNYGCNVKSIAFRLRFENMTADDLGNLKLWKEPFGTPYAFVSSAATDLASSYTVTREMSADKKTLTLTYTATGDGVWIYPEIGSRACSDRLWLTGELQNLKTLSDDARFYADVLESGLSLSGSSYKLENGIAAAPHRLYPWRYLVTAYMRRDRISAGNIGRLANAPEMRWPSLTHVIVSAFNVQYDAASDSMNIYWDANAEGAFKTLKEYRDQYHPACRLVPSLTKGGYVSLDSRGTGTAESRLAIAHAGEKKYRAAFVKYLIAKLEAMGADGLDIDWEYPDDNSGLDYNAYGMLLRDLAEAMFDHGWDLSMCSNFGYRMPGGEVMAAADYMSSMAYGVNRGLHSMNTAFTSATTMLVNKGVPRRRIVVGEAMYSTAKWHMGWDELAGRAGNDDDIINESWSYNGSTGNFIGFTGPTTYRAKLSRVKGVYADGYEYGGAMSWGYYCDTGWWAGKSLGWNQRQTIWPRPYNFPTPEKVEREGEEWYAINSENDWHWFTENAGSVTNVLLAADITFDHDPKPIPSFAGTFDGQGHTLTIPSGVWVVAFDRAGLFQQLSGTIRDLKLDVSGRFIVRNDRKNDTQTSGGWTLSAHGGDGAAAAALVATANAGAHLENIDIVLRAGSEIRGNHEVAALAGEVWSAGAGIVISNCTVDCAGTIWAKAVDSVGTLMTSGSGVVGNGRVGLLVGQLNFSTNSTGVALVDCSATLRKTGVLESLSGNYKTLGGLVGNLHVGATNADMVWKGLTMVYEQGATVAGDANTAGTAFKCQPFFGSTFGSSTATKPTLDADSVLLSEGTAPSGFDSALWLTGSWTTAGWSDYDLAAAPTNLPVTVAIGHAYATAAALVDLTAVTNGQTVMSLNYADKKIVLTAYRTVGNRLVTLRQGWVDSTGKLTENTSTYGADVNLAPGIYSLTLTEYPWVGTSLYVDGALATTGAKLVFSSDTVVSATFGSGALPLYAWDAATNACYAITYPKTATYDAGNIFTIGGAAARSGGGTLASAVWTVGPFAYPATNTAFTVNALVDLPGATNTPLVATTMRQNTTDWTIAYTPNGATGEKVVNFTHATSSGTTAALNGINQLNDAALKYGGSYLTRLTLGGDAGTIIGTRQVFLGAATQPTAADPFSGIVEAPAWYTGLGNDAAKSYYLDTLGLDLIDYEPSPVSVNGGAVQTGSAAAATRWLFGTDLEGETNLTFSLDAPLVADGQVGLTLAGSDPINAALKLQNAAEPSGPWTTAAEIAPQGTAASAVQSGGGTLASARTFVFATDDPASFYKLVTADSVTTPVAQGMPVSLTSAQKVNLGNLTIAESDIAAGTLTVQLAGAGVQAGLRAALVVNGTALVAHATAEGTLTFDLTACAARTPYQSVEAQLNLYMSGGLTNGDLYVSSPAVSGLTYSPAVLTAMVADGLKVDGFTTLGNFGYYRIPALASDGKGEVIACYDVRYGGSDLGGSGGIDVGESYSSDAGQTFARPHLAVDVPNHKDENGVTLDNAVTNDIGDVCILYDYANETYWMMGITGQGLNPGNWTKNDVVLYKRAKGADASWKPWRNPASTSDDPMAYRSIQSTIMAQGGVANSSGGYGYGFLEGPGHGFVSSKGWLVFPMQYFVDNGFYNSSVGAVYSKDGGQTWLATHRSATAYGPQENCVMELDDGSWYMTAKAGEYQKQGRLRFYRTKDFVEWTYVGEREMVRVQGSCLRLGKNKAGIGQYVYCHALHASSRNQLALVFGTDTTHGEDASVAPSTTNAGVAWDNASTLMLYSGGTGGMSYNSLTMLDDHTLGVLYEAQGHIYFIRIDVSGRLQ